MKTQFKIFLSTIIMLTVFIMIWAPVEYAISCPLGKDNFPEESCLRIKAIIWEIVAIMSFYTSDEIYLTGVFYDDITVDEMHSKNILPMIILGLIGTSYYFYSIRIQVSKVNLPTSCNICDDTENNHDHTSI